MKRIKTVLLSSILTMMCLTSCGTGDGYYGTYQFQMGKLNDTHIGIYMDLTKEKIDVEVDEKTVTMEKFTLKLSVPLEYVSGDEGGSLLGLGGLTDLFEKGIYGGYAIEKEMMEGEEYQKLSLIPVLAFTEDEGDSAISIPSTIIDSILIAKYSGSSISVTIPVSLTDLMFQLYWYGFDILNPTRELVEHELGSHPNAFEVEEIKKTFNDEEEVFIKHFNLDEFYKYQVLNTVEYRDFYQLTMGLAKAD